MLRLVVVLKGYFRGDGGVGGEIMREEKGERVWKRGGRGRKGYRVV